MTDAADILNALDIPAAVVDAAGAVTANAAFDAAGGAAAHTGRIQCDCP